MERKIGEIFEHNGEWYQCVGGRCKDCHFSEKRYICKQFITKHSCTSGIIYKKLKKVGEPFSCDYYGDSLIMMQEYNLYNLDDVTNEDNIPMYIADYKHKRIAIEIKQTKEDMEENKTPLPKEDNHLTRTVYNYVNGKISDKELIKSIKEMSDEYPYNKNNLKPFDLEAAKEGKPVCTRDGRKARIICFDKITCKNYEELKIIALVREKDNEDIHVYNNNGKKYLEDSPIDLMMLPEKKEGWINVYKEVNAYTTSEEIYQSKEEAIKANIYENVYLTTVKICWEE